MAACGADLVAPWIHSSLVFIKMMTKKLSVQHPTINLPRGRQCSHDLQVSWVGEKGRRGYGCLPSGGEFIQPGIPHLWQVLTHMSQPVIHCKKKTFVAECYY